MTLSNGKYYPNEQRNFRRKCVWNVKEDYYKSVRKYEAAIEILSTTLRTSLKRKLAEIHNNAKGLVRLNKICSGVDNL